eukprot:CAMPEP_0183511150 /NCGR_PEP_ID=MMETSP0371-20130417/10721_1 /TAXON_ID=268820 /ORGANISM="Peridinium aciculiferum, Strain PAER-2" /LENGTH=409 /DNA_ID=CAMNT_0025708041 /DNA_START=57 /DNA_END=1286 /DNA_ORIENTATION=+
MTAAQECQQVVAGAVAVSVEVNMEPEQDGAAVLAEGLRSLYAKGELCDMTLMGCGERFPAHKAMLAAMSDNFRKFLRLVPQNAEAMKSDPMEGLLTLFVPEQPKPAAAEASAAPPAAEVPAPTTEVAPTDPGVPVAPAAEGAAAPASVVPAAPAPEGAAAVQPPIEAAAVSEVVQLVKSQSWEFQIVGVATAEAVRIVLGYMYGVGTGAEWTYEPSSSEVNKDILNLAASNKFGLAHLHEHAARWLAKGLTTANVVERLVTCEEFGLGMLREKIIDQLTANPAELTVVSCSLEIMKHPRILQDLLCQVAALAQRGMVSRAAALAAQALEAEERVEKVVETQKAEPKPEEEKAEPEEVEEEAEPEPEKPTKKKEAPAKAASKSAFVGQKQGGKALEKPAAKKAKRGAAGA